jgi:putative membrane protein
MKIYKKILHFISAFLLAVPVSIFAAYNSGNCFNRLGFPGRHYGGHFFGGGLIMMLVIIILLGLLIFFAIKFFRNTKGVATKTENPVEILKMRFAKGEITKEVFDNIKKDM